jgi:hypothetical protein
VADIFDRFDPNMESLDRFSLKKNFQYQISRKFVQQEPQGLTDMIQITGTSHDYENSSQNRGHYQHAYHLLYSAFWLQDVVSFMSLSQYTAIMSLNSFSRPFSVTET